MYVKNSIVPSGNFHIHFTDKEKKNRCLSCLGSTLIASLVVRMGPDANRTGARPKTEVNVWLTGVTSHLQVGGSERPSGSESIGPRYERGRQGHRRHSEQSRPETQPRQFAVSAAAPRRHAPGQRFLLGGSTRMLGCIVSLLASPTAH